MDTEELRKLVTPSIFNRIERLFTPEVGSSQYAVSDVNKGIAAEKRQIKKRFDLNPALTGSMYTETNLPDSVDIDFFSNIADRDRFTAARSKLDASGDFTSSPYNVPGAPYAVYTRHEPGISGHPVDLAIATGDLARKYRKALPASKRQIAALPPELKQQLLEQKQLLRDTPFFSKIRYRRFKRNLREILDTPTLSRTSEHEKTSTVVDLEDREARDRFLRFLLRKDVVGHRTSAGDSVIQSGGVLPARELSRRGLLRNLEVGGVGKRTSPSDLNEQELQERLRDEVFVTRRGLLSDDSYGDTAILAMNRTAKRSPYLNLITDEAVVEPASSGKARKLSIGKGYVLAPQEKVQKYEESHPGYQYLVQETLPESIKKQLYKPVRSASEVVTRIVPELFTGNLKVKI